MCLFRPLPFARRVVALGIAAALTACSTLPAYSPPNVAVPAHYAGVPASGVPASGIPATAAPVSQPGWNVATPADAASRGPWWTVFDDAALNALEARVDISNQTVKKAVADLQQARAMVGYQRAGYLPTVTAGVAQSRSRLSQNKLGSSLAGKTTPDYQASVAASWEPDLFGRVRDAVTGAQANADASAADLQAVRLSVTAELATDYFALRSLDTQKQLLDETVRAYADALTLLKQQLAAGAIDASAVAQAETQLESTQTQDTDIDASRAQLQHARATLVGESASPVTLPPRGQAFDVPALPAGVPSQLL
ncbi:TolC family protein, partial [Burkholderia cepacia]|uniref:TolC family protein n=1 Tax=Burkholderia cepacia TaxID=292 RepID=UPI001C94ABB2